MRVNILPKSPGHMRLHLPLTNHSTEEFSVVELEPCETLMPKEEFVFQSLKSVLGKIAHKSRVLLKIQIKPVGTANKPLLCCQIGGLLLKTMHQLLHSRNPRALGVKLVLRVLDSDALVTPKFNSYTGDVAYQESDSSYIMDCSEVTTLEPRDSPYLVKFFIEVDLSEYIPSLNELLPLCDEKCRKIFETRRHCDFIIESSEGTSYSCHKEFLCISSGVLASMIESDFREAKEGKLRVTDLCDQSTLAFLEFSYCNSVVSPIASSKVAFELLRAADYYDMPLLWSAIMTIFPFKRASWFGTEFALRIFEFINKKSEKEGAEELKQQIIQVHHQLI